LKFANHSQNICRTTVPLIPRLHIE
jgi:hypothetical protein